MIARLAPDRNSVIGLAAIGMVALILVLGLSGVITRLLTGTEQRTVVADFASTQQLRQGDQVRVQGVKAGEVAKIERIPGGTGSRVTMDVDEDAGGLYRDAGVRVRWRNVLGGAFYLDLQRGTAGLGELRGTIPASRTADQVEVEDVVAVVQGRAQRGLATLPPELTKGLADPQAPAQLLDGIGDVGPSIAKGLHAVRGQELDTDLKGLVRNAASTVAALDTSEDSLRGVVGGAGTTLRTVANRNTELQQSLMDGPATAVQAQQTLTRLRGTLDLAGPLLDDLDKPAKQVAPTLAKLRPQLVQADTLLQRAVPLLRSLRPAAADLARTAQVGNPLVRDLEPSLDRLDDKILPYLAREAPDTGKSTTVMIGGTFTGLGSGAAGQTDGNGHFIRFPATTGSAPINSLPCQLYINNPDSSQAVACNEIGDALKTFLNYSPLSPVPGSADSGQGG